MRLLSAPACCRDHTRAGVRRKNSNRLCALHRPLRVGREEAWAGKKRSREREHEGSLPTSGYRAVSSAQTSHGVTERRMQRQLEQPSLLHPLLTT